MTKFVVLFLACLAFASARQVRRDASTPFEDIQKHAAEFQKTFSEQVSKFTSSQNTQEVSKALKEGADSILQQISSFTNTISSAINDANGKSKELLQNTRTSFERTMEDLRKAHPDVEQQAGELKNKLQNAIKSTAEETQKLAKEIGANMEQTNEKLAPQLKQAYEDFVKQAEAVQKKLHEVATKQ